MVVSNQDAHALSFINHHPRAISLLYYYDAVGIMLLDVVEDAHIAEIPDGGLY